MERQQQDQKQRGKGKARVSDGEDCTSQLPDPAELQRLQQQLAQSFGPNNPAMSPLGAHLSPAQLDYLHECQEHHHNLQEQLKDFWAKQLQDVQDNSNLKNHTLPLARVRKEMKFKHNVERVSTEAPILLAKACEMFIMELSLRSWLHTDRDKRCKLQNKDIASAVSETKVYNFLSKILPRDTVRDASNIAASVPLVRPPLPPPHPYINMPPPPPQHPYPFINTPMPPHPFPYPYMVMLPPQMFPYIPPYPPQIGDPASDSAPAFFSVPSDGIILGHSVVNPSMFNQTLYHNELSQPSMGHSLPPESPQRDQSTPDE